MLGRRHLLEHAQLARLGHFHVFGVALGECGAIELVEIGSLFRIEHVPVVARFHALHEFIGDKDGGVGGAHAEIVVAGIVLPVDVFGEVVVPVLHVEAECAELFAAALHSADRGIHDLGERCRA